MEIAGQSTTDAPSPSSAAAASTDTPTFVSRRLTSLDAFRGFTMVFMASEILRIPGVARGFPDSRFAGFVRSMLDHVPWVGWSPWDLIQPSFMFMVGVALPFSVARRRDRGDDFGPQFAH